MPRPSNTEERRQQIVDALLRVMATHGYERATVAKIARDAGLGAGLVHYHFESKREILVALVEQLSTRFEDRFDAAVRRTTDDPRKRIDAFVDAALALGEGADPASVQAWVFIGAEALRQPEVRAVYQSALERRLALLEGCLRPALRASGRSGRNARRIAALVICAIEGAYQVGSAAPELLPVGFAAPTLRRAVAAILESEARPGRAFAP
jgi:TetR/AcrR family transcriptional regulator, transcriptional repressor of bet genes